MGTEIFCFANDIVEVLFCIPILLEMVFVHIRGKVNISWHLIGTHSEAAQSTRASALRAWETFLYRGWKRTIKWVMSSGQELSFTHANFKVLGGILGMQMSSCSVSMSSPRKVLLDRSSGCFKKECEEHGCKVFLKRKERRDNKKSV